MSAGPPRPEEAPRHQVGGRNIYVAVAVGVVLFVVMITAIFSHPLALTALIGVLLVVAIVESGRTLEDHDQRIDVSLLLIVAAITLSATYLYGPEDADKGQVLGVAALFIGTVFAPIVDGDRGGLMRRMGRNAFFGLWIVFNASFAIRLNLPDTTDASVATIAVIGSAVVTDIGAFAFGVSMGKRKVAPRLSPNKTWEGLVGGVATTGVLGAIILPLIGDRFDPLTAFAVCAVSGLAGFFGDLTESMVKRDLGIKDFGTVLPGHGGILDRVDGILLALPAGFYTLDLLIR